MLEISKQNSAAAVFTTAGTRANSNSSILHICLRYELRNQKFSVIPSGVLKNYSSAILR